MRYRISRAALAAFFIGLAAPAALAQSAPQGFDPRTVAQQLKALGAIVELREAEIRAMAADMKAQEAKLKAEIDKHKPAPAESPMAEPPPADPTAAK